MDDRNIGRSRRLGWLVLAGTLLGSGAALAQPAERASERAQERAQTEARERARAQGVMLPDMPMQRGPGKGDANGMGPGTGSSKSMGAGSGPHNRPGA